MDEPDPKSPAPEPAKLRDDGSVAEEVKLIAVYWAEIQAEMNRILAQEED